ncbi:Npr3 protein [Maudiozyma humilis]|uniref:Nitrogen permease regulator 3 n=1 Tax=Maudiozyma humilis TaxID=51915 RepID=A0AAV5S4Y0_MAUHU|nr:Npr3 protein [Kazachstania humilis]
MNEYLPNSYLLGIQLTISTHSGQQVVYSYPPSTLECASAVTNKFRPTKILTKRKEELTRHRTHDDSDSSSSSSSSWSSGLSDSELSTDESDESLLSSSDTASSTESRTPERLSTAQLLDMFNVQQREARERLDIEMNDIFFQKENFQDTDKIFGFNSEFVAEFCTPDRDLCNTRFEFTIDEFCFLGFPIHSDSNGKWRKSKHKKQPSRKSASISHARRKRSSTIVSTQSSHSKHTDSRSLSKKSTNNTDHITLNASVDEEQDDDNDTDNEDDTSDLTKSMNMFHVCFIMNPPLIEFNNRVDDMYQHVVAKLSLLLRYMESKNNFVSNECSIILREREDVMKNSEMYRSIKTPCERGRYLYERILKKSSLARSLTKCVDQLHKNEIASIELDDKMISLQIPIHDEFSTIGHHRLLEILPHSYLTSILNRKFIERASSAYNNKSLNPTTSNMASRYHKEDQTLGNKHNVRFSSQFEDDTDDDDDILNYALLLLDEPANILKNLETVTPEKNATDHDGNNSPDVNAVILRQLIKHIQPTVALINYHYIITDILQIESSNIAYDILRSFALHLIYWRHARVIIPISSKYTYAVSPLLKLTSLYLDDERRFRSKFPSLPSLSYFLSNLSESDIPETKKNFNASNISKVMGNTEKNVTIRPFGSLIPSKQHKGIYLGALSWLIKNGFVYQLLTFVHIRVDKNIKMNVEEDLEKEGLSKQGRRTFDREGYGAGRTNKLGSSTDMNKFDSVGTDNLQADGISGGLLNSRDPSSDEFVNFEYDDPEMQRDYTIILEPERATALEKRWLFKCIADQPTDIQQLFRKLLKYFNGRTPLELVILRERISRHDIRRLFNALDKYLIEVRHW